MSFDLAQLEKVDTGELEILDLAKQPTGIFFELYNMDSEVAEEAQKKYMKRVRNWHKGKRNKQNLSKAEEAELERISYESMTRMLAECTANWRTATKYDEKDESPVEFKDAITVDGQELECTFENAKQLYADKRFKTIRRQVDSYINEDSNFLPS